jgi:hypothetical protein
MSLDVSMIYSASVILIDPCLLLIRLSPSLELEIPLDHLVVKTVYVFVQAVNPFKNLPINLVNDELPSLLLLNSSQQLLIAEGCLALLKNKK